NAQLVGTEAGLIGYWRLADGSGQTINDYSSTNNDGMLGSTASSDINDPVFMSACPISGVGVHELSFGNNNFLIYPNPSNGSFKIKGAPLNTNLEIFNMLGEKIYSVILNESENKIEMKNASAGIYFVKMSAGEKVYTQ